MKQIIVNVSGLSPEEKQRVNEALAKITGATKLSLVNSIAGLFVAPHSPGTNRVTWSFPSPRETPTHSPAEVLEMAGMETSTDQHLALADKVTITDSPGRTIFDGHIESISTFIKSRTNAGSLPSSGFSVKTDENGVAVMVAKRKVRKDFDPTGDYRVNVSGCTKEEKKEVQQAFFDAGLPWKCGGKEYRNLDAVQYSNTYNDGTASAYCLFGVSTKEANMTPDEFLELVYEPVQQGHVHVDLMAQYTSIAAIAEDPWNYFEIFHRFDGKEAWITLQEGQFFKEDCKYRRKPKTHEVNGVEVPDLRIKPKEGERFYLVDPTEPEFTFIYMSTNDSFETMWAERGLCYEPTEEGKQAAILHAKAWLGIA